MWFSLGCAAQQVGEQDLAIQAFQRCVSLEADVSKPLLLVLKSVSLQFAEAWNNLATIYLKRKEKLVSQFSLNLIFFLLLHLFAD